MLERFRLRRLAFGTCLAALVVGVSAAPAAAVPASADQPQTQSVYDAQWPLRGANVQRVWTTTKGQGIRVAVIDSGVDASHPDLVGRVTGGGDFANGASGDGTQDVVAPEGHGTEVASLIAGTGKNFDGDGLLGLAPEAKILAYGVYEDGQPDPSAVAKAVRAAVADGAQIILTPSSSVMARPAVLAAVRDALESDAVVVSGVDGSAGSTAGTTTGPAVMTRRIELPGVVTVAAVDRNGKVWSAPEPGTRVALAAPGVDVLAASTDDRYWAGSDSSFAASWVAGAAALVRAAHPGWTAVQTIEKLIDTARPSGTGCTDDCGYGVVDPLKAVSDTTKPAAKTNPLLSATGPRQETATRSVRTAVDPERIMFFVVSAAAALMLYVAVTTVFIRRQRSPGD